LNKKIGTNEEGLPRELSEFGGVLKQGIANRGSHQAEGYNRVNDDL
jgi:hypothetical protein